MVCCTLQQAWRAPSARAHSASMLLICVKDAYLAARLERRVSEITENRELMPPENSRAQLRCTSEDASDNTAGTRQRTTMGSFQRNAPRHFRYIALLFGDNRNIHQRDSHRLLSEFKLSVETTQRRLQQASHAVARIAIASE